MTPRQSVAVGVRLFSVWLLLDGLATGYFSFIELGMNHSAGAVAFGLVLALVWVLAAAALWRFPGAVARKLVPDDVNDASSSAHGLPADLWFETGCALIGIWLIVTSLAPLTQSIVETWMTVDVIESGAYFLIRIILGVGLVLGARGVRKIVRWTQYAGIQRSEASDDGQ